MIGIFRIFFGMDACGNIHPARLAEPMQTESAKRMTSEEVALERLTSAASTPMNQWHYSISASGRKFKFRPRYADEGLESFHSSDSEHESPCGEAATLKSSPKPLPTDRGHLEDLSFTQKSPQQRITNIKHYDLCSAPPRE